MQDQDINVRTRVQFAAAVAAHGQQGNVRVVGQPDAFPGVRQHLINDPGTLTDQLLDVIARLEAFEQYLAGVTQHVAVGGARQGLAGIQLGRIKQGGIHGDIHHQAFAGRRGVRPKENRSLLPCAPSALQPRWG